MVDVEIKPTQYKDARPPERFAAYHARVRAGEPDGVYELVRTVTVLHALITFRARGIGGRIQRQRAQPAAVKLADHRRRRCCHRQNLHQ